MRLPGWMCFSTTSLGELKNTMESLSALSTNPAASARTPRLPPIRTRRRCLRVMSAFEPQFLDQLVQMAEPIGIAIERAAGVAGRSSRLILVAEHHIGA